MAAEFNTLTPADCDRLLRAARHRRRFRQTLTTFARANRAKSGLEPKIPLELTGNRTSGAANAALGRILFDHPQL